MVISRHVAIGVLAALATVLQQPVAMSASGRDRADTRQVPSAHAPGAQAASASGATGTVRGAVVDRAGGAAIRDVSVAVQDTGLTVKTDDEGRFELTNVPAGPRNLYVSVVGFILVKRAVEVRAGTTLELTIALSEGTGTYSETVEVKGERFREQDESVPAQQTLGSADVQNLRNLLTNDPMRAIQVLPGVTTGDDFRSEFAVRASPFSRMNFTFDGIPTTFLLHTVQQVQDGGSIAMVNGDVLDGITLLNGSYPQRYGNRLGAELDFHMREGSRERTQLRTGVSGTDASVVAEGPLGGRKAGSWLVSARKSYLDLLLKQITDDNDFGFGFSDVQSKLVYDVSSAHRIELGLVAGRSRLDQTAGIEEVNEVKDGRNSAELLTGAWRFMASPSLLITQRVAFGANQYSNRSAAGLDLARGGGRDITWRADLVARASRSLNVEAGGQVQRQQRDLVQREITTLPAQVLTVESYDAVRTLASAYAQVRWSPSAVFGITPGLRIDRASGSNTTSSPWVLADVALGRGFKLRGGAGIHRQYPGFDESFGLRAGIGLEPERATHADIGLEHSVGARARWQITLYNRSERNGLRLPDSDVRRVGDTIFVPSETSRWINAFDGHARGVEFLVQRRSTAGLTGWVSYSFGVNEFRDRTTGETFDGDFDQRHTFNAYGLYRLSDKFSVAAKLRVGSNTPAVGYWEQRESEYFVGSTRNDVRVPTYSRLDVRANRVFNHRSTRLTLFVEVMNVLGRDNVRFNSPGINFRTGQAFGMFESMIPLVPSAGVLIEF